MEECLGFLGPARFGLGVVDGFKMDRSRKPGGCPACVCGKLYTSDRDREVGGRSLQVGMASGRVKGLGVTLGLGGPGVCSCGCSCGWEWRPARRQVSSRRCPNLNPAEWESGKPPAKKQYFRRWCHEASETLFLMPPPPSLGALWACYSSACSLSPTWSSPSLTPGPLAFGHSREGGRRRRAGWILGRYLWLARRRCKCSGPQHLCLSYTANGTEQAARQGVCGMLEAAGRRANTWAVWTARGVLSEEPILEGEQAKDHAPRCLQDD